MVLMRIQSQILINQSNNINTNKQSQMDASPAVIYVLIPFEGNINPGYQQDLKIHLK